MRRPRRFRFGRCVCLLAFALHLFSSSALAQPNNVWPIQVRADVETRPSSSPLLIGDFDIEVRKMGQVEGRFKKIRLEASLQDALGLEFLSFKQELSSELAECLSNPENIFCSEENIFLPSALLEKACEIDLRLISGRRTVAAAEDVSIGNCHSSIEFDNRYDFAAMEDYEVVSEEGESILRVHLTSFGQSSNHRALRVGAVVRDFENKILWSEILYLDEQLRRNQIEKIQFMRGLSPKVMHLGCSLSVHVNVRGDYQESDYSNNDKIMGFGDCLEPDEQNVDIAPSLEVQQDKINLTLMNLGEVDIEGSLNARILLRDERGRKISDFVEKIRPGVIEAYGGQFTWPVLRPQNLCSIEVLVDPRYEIQNENRENNQIKLDICE